MKHLRKTQKSWSEEELTFHAQQMLNHYLLLNKEKLAEWEAKDQAEFEKALDQEFFNLFLDNT